MLSNGTRISPLNITILNFNYKMTNLFYMKIILLYLTDSSKKKKKNCTCYTSNDMCFFLNNMCFSHAFLIKFSFKFVLTIKSKTRVFLHANGTHVIFIN
jgi:hypothetical protein